MAKSEKTVVVAGRGGRGASGGRGAKNPVKTFKRIINMMMKDYKAQFIIVLIMIALTAAISVYASAFLKPLIDDYVVPLIGVANPNFSSLATALITVAGIYVLSIVFSYVSNRLMVNVAQGTLNAVREEMFAKMQKLPLKYFDTTTHGNLMSRFTNDTDTLREMMGHSITQILSSAITIIGVLITMFIYSWILTLVVLLSVFVSMLIVKNLGGKSGKYFLKQQKSLGAVNGYIEEMVEGQRVVKVFNYEEKAEKKFDELSDVLRENATKANGYSNILMPVMGNIGNLLYVVIAFLGSGLALSGVGGLTLGVIGSFLLLSKSFTMTITQVSQQFNSIIMALAGAERIFELMDEKPEVDDGTVTLVKADKDVSGNLTENENGAVWAWKNSENCDASLTELKGDVRFNGVVFGYKEDSPVLKDVNLYAKPGQKIAFIGETGAGKTTITNLINRFYDVNSGEITYDGINVKDIKKNDLRRSLGIVLQDTNLFTGTVADNIRLGKLDASIEEVKAAAVLANADFFISHLPNGYDTVITGNGENLSQGQRQLLAIARAAIANPPVLILDEATSSIDTRTEKIIGKGIDKLMEGRTVFVIAHRLSTVRDSNAIIVLSHGEIIERGDHADLMKKKGQYYRFYTGAFELD